MAVRVQKKPVNAYQHGNLRHALVQAGVRLLSEGGTHNLSLRAAAQLAGVSHAAPYRHFADKDALIAAIAEEGFGLLSAQLRASTLPVANNNVTVRLQAMSVAYVSFALEHPAYLRVIFGGVVNKAAAPESLQAAGQTAYRVLRDLVAEGVNAGEFRNGDPDELALAVWSMVHGLGMLITDSALPPPHSSSGPAEQLTRTLMALLESGIAKRL